MMVIITEIEQKRAPSTIIYRYDVFISFRGVDTGLTFTAHLHKALLKANIIAVLDNDELQTEEDLKPELESAIKASRTSVIVLSKNYASSTQCLDELVLTLDQRRNFNHIVIPIFYHVDPTDVRKQVNSFGEAMEKHNQRIKAESNAEIKSQLGRKMKTWKKALAQVANIDGKDARGRLETEIIEEIVNDIYTSIGVSLRRNFPLLIGMDYSINFISSWLEDGSSHTADILTIMGMNGIGKTSLAKYIYKLHHHLFDRSSFIVDINRKCLEQSGNILDLQRQLYSDISEQQSTVQVYDVSVYTSKIEKALEDKEVLLVLDDVDSLVHLYLLLGNKGFCPGSKIIITTKHASLTKSFKLYNSNVEPKHTLDTLKGLNEASSLQLFNFHAFKHLRPMDSDYKHVSEELAKLCQGHPLALNVLAKSLRDQDVAEWEEFMEELKQDTHSHIQKVLRKSFDSLPSTNFKELFLYIACFFVGMDSGYAETILKACGIRTLHGTRFLLDRSLLTISPRNELKMHQLLQDMGKDVVLQESPNKPWKRSRIWCHEESFNVMQQKKGKGNLKGMVLDMRMVEKTKSHVSVELETDALSNMNNLKLLQLNYVQLNGSYKNFPKELRWLCMHGFPSHSMPSDLFVENLVALDMSYSNLESFDMSYSNPHRLGKTPKLVGPSSKEKRLLGSLKILNLSFCDKLRSLGGFIELPALEKLIVSNCIVLTEVSESIERCHELVILDMSYCYKLKKLPRALAKLKKVKTVLEGCNLGEHPPQMGKMDSMKILNAKDSGITSPTSFSAVVKAMPKSFKTFEISLPICLVTLSLSNSNLSNESFPVDFSSLSMLENLCLDNNPIDSIPYCMISLPRLKTLSLSNCDSLKSLEKVTLHPEKSAPPEVDYYNVSTMTEIQGKFKLEALLEVRRDTTKGLIIILKAMPKSFKTFEISSSAIVKAKPKRFKTFEISSSAIVKAMPNSFKTFEISLPIYLVALSLSNNNLSNESFPVDFSSLSMLKYLCLDNNPIDSVPDCVRSLPRLQTLSLCNCDSLKTILYAQNTIKNLYIQNCSSLEKVTFHPEKSAPPEVDYDSVSTLTEIQGKFKLEALSEVNEEVLHSLGWKHLEYSRYYWVMISDRWGYYVRGDDIISTQLLYEHGIFSTYLKGQEVPKWFTHRSSGSSFTLQSARKNCRISGINLCIVSTISNSAGIGPSRIVIRNLTKNSSWTYEPVLYPEPEDIEFRYGDDIVVWLSHWMFRNNEFEDGDKVSVHLSKKFVYIYKQRYISFGGNGPDYANVREYGISLVYDDGNKKEDPLAYYKSWNHIIGRDLSPFELSTGHYLLKQWPDNTSELKWEW